eukprot:3486741-Prymnesium_polylepis.2
MVSTLASSITWATLFGDWRILLLFIAGWFFTIAIMLVGINKAGAVPEVEAAKKGQAKSAGAPPPRTLMSLSMCHAPCAVCHAPCVMRHVPCAMCHAPCAITARA